MNHDQPYRASQIGRGCTLRVVQIGRYPPPYGGVTIHIQRLAELCHREGIDCQVLDPYRHTTDAVLPPFVHHRGRYSPGNLVALYRLVTRSDFDIAHVHVSSMARFMWWGRLLTASARARVKILTIHHGNFVENYLRGNRLQQLLIRKALNSFNVILLPTADLRDSMVSEFGVLAAQTEVIHSFIQPSEVKIAPSFGPFDQFIQTVRDNSGSSTILVSGFGFSYYGYDILIEALKKVAEAGKSFAVVISLYGPEDETYRKGVVSRLQAICPTLTFQDLDPEHFLYLLAHCDVYVRPTLVDSCGVSVYEALMLGTPVVASDVCRRPPGVFLHKTGDASSLAQQILYADESKEQHKGRPVVSALGAGAELIELYRSLVP